MKNLITAGLIFASALASFAQFRPPPTGGSGSIASTIYTTGTLAQVNAQVRLAAKGYFLDAKSASAAVAGGSDVTNSQFASAIYITIPPGLTNDLFVIGDTNGVKLFLRVDTNGTVTIQTNISVGGSASFASAQVQIGNNGQISVSTDTILASGQLVLLAGSPPGIKLIDTDSHPTMPQFSVNRNGAQTNKGVIYPEAGVLANNMTIDVGGTGDFLLPYNTTNAFMGTTRSLSNELAVIVGAFQNFSSKISAQSNGTTKGSSGVTTFNFKTNATFDVSVSGSTATISLPVSSASSGGIPATNANQFAANTNLTIADGAQLTNLNVRFPIAGGTALTVNTNTLVVKDGQVGVGKVPTSATLDVSGSAVISGNLTADSFVMDFANQNMQIGRLAAGKMYINGAAVIAIGNSAAASFPALGRTNGDLIILGGDGLFGSGTTNRLILPGGLVVGAGDSATLTNTLYASATLDFPSTAAGAVSDLPITVSGASDGDVVSIGVKSAALTGLTGDYFGWSSNGVVYVRFANNNLVSAQDPSSQIFKVRVDKFK